jgi:hypothetical protein
MMVTDFLKKAFKQGNQVQNCLTDNFKAGMSGNDILAKALEQSKKQGLQQMLTSLMGREK